MNLSTSILNLIITVLLITGCANRIYDNAYRKNRLNSREKVNELAASLGAKEDTVVYYKYYYGTGVSQFTLNNSILTEYQLTKWGKLNPISIDNRICQEKVWGYLDSTKLLSVDVDLPSYPQELKIHDGGSQHIIIMNNSDTLYNKSFWAEHREYGDSSNLNMQLLYRWFQYCK